MMDQFLEQVATKRSSGTQMIMLGMAWVTMIISGLYGMLVFSQVAYAFSESVTAGLIQIAAAVVFLGGAVLIWLFKDRLRTEYEYTFTNGALDFAAVYNNRKRKALGTMNLKNIKACGQVASGSFNRYINQPGIKRKNWFANRDGNLFYIYYEKEQEKHIIIMEPSEEMAGLIRGAVPRGSYEIN